MFSFSYSIIPTNVFIQLFSVTSVFIKFSNHSDQCVYSARQSFQPMSLFSYSVILTNVSEIILQFVQINITDYCSETTFDFLTVYDGDSIGSPVLGTITGCDVTTFSQVAPVFTSSQSNMFVQFISDESTTMTGFTATYKSIQG